MEDRQPEAAARLDFESLEGAWKLLSGRRWAILRAMAGQGPLAIREIARRVDRDVRAVHSDVRATSTRCDRQDAGREDAGESHLEFA